VWSAFAVVAALQAATLPPRALAGVARSLQATEIAIVLNGSRLASAGKTFALSFPGGEQGPEILMPIGRRPPASVCRWRAHGAYPEW